MEGTTQLVRHLCGMFKALGSIPSTEGKEETEGRMERKEKDYTRWRGSVTQDHPSPSSTCRTCALHSSGKKTLEERNEKAKDEKTRSFFGG